MEKCSIYPKNMASIFKPIDDLEHASSYEELGYNDIGEVCISGPTVMLGYFGNDKSTSEILRKHEDGRLWLHTRDLGYMTEDGKLFVLDRIKIQNSATPLGEFEIPDEILLADIPMLVGNKVDFKSLSKMYEQIKDDRKN